MRRTELLQEVRKMRFEEVLEIWTKRSINQEEAARMLGELALHGITTMEKANLYIEEVYLPACNAQLQHPAAQDAYRPLPCGAARRAG